MDLVRRDSVAGRPEIGPPGDYVLPSRASALDACRVAAEGQLGPLLLTGQPGVGKSWLWRKLARSFPPYLGAIAVDLAPGDTPADLIRAILHSLGLSDDGRRSNRLTLHEELARRSDEGERWLLVLDEAQNGSDLVLEEVRLLANRLGESDGFESMLLVGQPELAQRLKGRSLQGLRNRLGAHVVLAPLDIEEAGALLRSARPGITWDQDSVDHHHRATSGNPRRLLLQGRIESVQPARASKEGISARSPWGLAAKPPLRVEEGLIEVGWSPETSASSSGPHRPESSVGATTTPRSSALNQDPENAWDDWDDEADRESDEAEARIDAETLMNGQFDSEGPDEGVDDDDSTQLRAEPQHGFAPYGPLFSKLRPARDPE